MVGVNECTLMRVIICIHMKKWEHHGFEEMGFEFTTCDSNYASFLKVAICLKAQSWHESRNQPEGIIYLGKILLGLISFCYNESHDFGLR